MTREDAMAGTYPSPSVSVLIVDDDAEVRRHLSRALDAVGFRVTVASDGCEGLQAARRQRPDVVLLDLSMAGCDGEHFRSGQLADDRLRDIPVICISSAPASMPRGFTFDAWFPKPVHVAALVAAVRAYGSREA